MHRLKLAIIFLMMALFSNLFAADLINKDKTDYSIKVVTGEDTKEITIKAGATISGICDECTIYISGSDEPFDVYEGDVIVIKDGDFEVQES